MIKKLAFAGLGLALLATPLISSADALSDLQAQVQVLMAQLQALRAQTSPVIPPLPPSPPTGLPDDFGTGATNAGVYCPKLSITLQKGSRDATTGGQVSELQTFLTDYYNLDENIVVGGYFGNLTHKYVVQFQTEQGLPALGIVGSLTRAKIASVCGGGTPTPPPPPPPTFPGVTLQVTPQTANTFVANINVGQWTFYTYEIDWGEGDDTRQTIRSRVSVVCNSIWTCSAPPAMSHTYASPGTYNIRLYALKGEIAKTLAATASARVSEIPSTASITVTAPNGGEQWEIGTMNTVTWTPYQYNPDINPSKDVTAYLEVSECGAKEYGCFRTLGKVQESGKASIHWITGELDSATQGGVYAPSGNNYFIRVVNNVTGASDRSDAPFTLLPKPVNLKLNGSDGPIAATAGVSLIATWAATGVTTCRLDNAYDQPNPNVYPIPAFQNLPSSGSATIYVPSQQNWYVNLACQRSDGAWVYDSVVTNQAAQAASLKVVSPNGGETLTINQSYDVSFYTEGVKSASIALYKNDQWMKWIAKDISMSTFEKGGSYHYRWIPSDVEAEAVPLGNVFKIYVTGQKADGTGYVDDKSDAPFGFISSPTVLPTHTVAPATPTNLNGTCIGGGQTRLSWNASPEADYYLVRVNDASNDSPSCQDGWYCASTSDARIEGTTATSYTGPAVPEKTYTWWILAGNNVGYSSTAVGPSAWCPISNGTPNVASSAESNANLANALTALEPALKALLARLSQ